ncbi:fimbria/pilus outer membrane usher protein [Serratia bockelmannii]|uniref:fimbria/pilus outer membrane usher protein n=1 Tax=Serratia bockelmannii TaxID=2703793 RepID=UPI003FA6D72C
MMLKSAKNNMGWHFFVPVYMVLAINSAHARDYFDSNLLKTEGQDINGIDLSSFERGGQMPGNYTVDVYINEAPVAQKRTISFYRDDADKLLPRLSRQELSEWGIDMANLQGQQKGESMPLSMIPGARSELDLARLRLNMSVPQKFMQKTPRGYVAPSFYDDGINALLLNYNVNGSTNTRDGGTGDSYFASLNAGVNLGGWRFRNNLSYNQYTSRQSDNKKEKKSDLQSVSTYAQRGIAALRSQLIIGDGFTTASAFDSVPFRGVQLASDEDMLPDSMRGFAPVVRGTANTNARVTIRQNGYVIYQSFLPPGYFEISDLYPTSTAGDLLITITEADGSERRFVQPFSSVGLMRREGSWKYGASVGRYRPTGSGDNFTPIFSQFEGVYGINNLLTVYGGGQFSEKYSSVVLGNGIGLGEWGALSLDVSLSQRTQESNAKRYGGAYRATYVKNMLATGTSVSLAAYKYATGNYMTFSEGMRKDSNSSFSRKMNEFKASLNQSLDDYGSVFLNASVADYWNRKGSKGTLSMGYNFSYRSILFSIAYLDNNMINKDKTDGDRQISANVQVPMSVFSPRPQLADVRTSYGVANSRRGGTSHQLGVTGSAYDNQVNYSVSKSVTGGSGSNGDNLSLRYQGGSGTLLGGYSRQDGNQVFNYGASGGVVVHSYGVTLSQPLGETVALLQAPQAKGIPVNYGSGVSTDWRGYAVVPYLTPYHKTTLSLDPAVLAENVELQETSRQVVPTRGAVVLANYRTDVGRKVLFTLRQGKEPIPFATLVKIAGADKSAMVGDNGEVYLTGMPDSGELLVAWRGECRVRYSFSEQEKANEKVILKEGECL